MLGGLGRRASARDAGEVYKHGAWRPAGVAGVGGLGGEACQRLAGLDASLQHGDLVEPDLGEVAVVFTRVGRDRRDDDLAPRRLRPYEAAADRSVDATVRRRRRGDTWMSVTTRILFMVTGVSVLTSHTVAPTAIRSLAEQRQQPLVFFVKQLRYLQYRSEMTMF